MQYLNNETYLLKLLLDQGLIDNQQRQDILALKDRHRRKLSRARQHRDSHHADQVEADILDIITSLKLTRADQPEEALDEETIMRAIATDCQLPFKKLNPLDLDLKTVTKTLPRSFAAKHLILPFTSDAGTVSLAICEPGNRTLLEEIERTSQLKVIPHISCRSDIRKMLAEFFVFQTSISAAETQLTGPLVDLSNLEQYVKITSSKEITSSDRNIKSAVDHLFNYAFDERASDIHIEPKRESSRVRLRIDGVLHTIYDLPKVVHSAIISRIKTLSRLDIAEKRRPQDGRIKVDRSGREAEIRVSTIPVAFGEKAVMRILSSDILFQDLISIGFSQQDYQLYQNLINNPHGIFLVTGPTGSGKSTTLYATLKSLASPDINIVTVEDPVEMVHEEFNQISVQPQIDVTFANILRNILRQDPDIIMIGEIRDLETARNAVQAALTGHLVFSTLHTNGAASAITRLADLGVQPFLISSTIIGAMAQRLVRTICPHCIEEITVKTSELKDSGFPLPDQDELTLKKGKGCRKCRNTGYLGRCGIFEMFAMSDAIRQLINEKAPTEQNNKTARREGMTALKEDAWQKVINGVTTHEEALRVTGAG